MSELFRPELLAPAGNMEMALAALDGGADALYLGLGRFNARERAENFTPETLHALLDHAHRLGRKIYVAVNTLVKENELDAAAEELARLAGLGPDAIILQDPGILKLARDYFPALALHASTQMGIHNTPGIMTAARLGIRRVILERQMTLAEVAQTAKNTPVELEVFIHGSLCTSLSGRCLFSSWFGGESGNRGRCKQPCRRSYRAADGKDAGFWFSMCDLDGLSLVEEFRRLKIASLKIEGRLRSPDYVWKSVRAYRTVLDDPSESAYEEARKILDSAAARNPGGGFYRSRFDRLTRPRTPGVFGTPVGRVLRAGADGIQLELTGRLHLGDRLRLVPPDGGEGAALTLIRMQYRRRDTVSARRGQEVFLPGAFTAAAGFQVYKIGENGFDYRRQANALPPGRFPVDLELRFTAAGLSAGLRGHEFRYPYSAQPARNQALAPEDLCREFGEGVPEPWRAGNIAATVDGNYFLPASEGKKMRRAFWEWARELLQSDPAEAAGAAGLARFREDRRNHIVAPPVAGYAPEFRIPGFIPESEVAFQRDQIALAYRQGVRNFAVGSWHGWELLREYSGINRLALPPFPVANSQAAALAAELGAAAFAPWTELEQEAVDLLGRNTALPVCAEVSAPTELLVSRAELGITGAITDGRGNRFRLEYDRQAGLTRLYPEAGARIPYRGQELK